MFIKGSFTDFSLAEILQFIEQGRKTGLLTVRAMSESQGTLISPFHYIWVRDGRIVAAANRLDHQGLVKLIEQHQWVSDRVLDKLVHWCCLLGEPLGKYLKNQGVLRVEQLQQLFNIQVVKQVSALVQLKNGVFEFDQNAPIPMQELTGLSVSAAGLSSVATSKNATALPQVGAKPNIASTTRALPSPSSGKNSKPYTIKKILEKKLPPKVVA